ncbi:MAG TPA: hypothetical protein VJR70_01610 [Stellaceae bacterium]|nr:hypothetical protein [Stellaceae bacterium]
MTDHVEFLREKAKQLRALASAEAAIAEELRRLADELDEMAAATARRPGAPQSG